MPGTSTSAPRAGACRSARALASTSRAALIAALASPLALGWAASAWAADAPAAAATPASDAAKSDKVPEVVVTATYRATNVQKTPISITAVTGEQLEQRSITNIVDAAQAAPNVTMRLASTGGGMSNEAYIRGIGQGDFLFAYSPKISFYVDDVYFSTVYGSTFQLVDVDNVTIERGPQGTLNGRNSVGGAIKIYSKKPTGSGGGYLEATGGTDARFGIRGAIDEPIVQDKLMLRLSGVFDRQDGWVDVLNFSCVHPEFNTRLPTVGTNTKQGCKEGTLGGHDYWATRAQLRWVVNDKIEDNLEGDYTDERDDSAPDVLLAAPQYDTLQRQPGPVAPGQGGSASTPNGLGIWMGNIGGPDYNIPLNNANCLTGITQFSGVAAGINFAPRNYCLPTAAFMAALYPGNLHTSYASFGNPGLSGSNPAGENLPPGIPNYLDKNSNFQDPNVNNLKSWGVANTLEINLSDELHIRSITAGRGYSGVFGSSQAALAVPVQEAFQGVSHHQFSQELTLLGSLFNKRLDYVLGGFYLNTGERNTGRVDFEGFGISGGPDVQDFLIDDPATLRNRSAFIHGTFHITDALSIEGGVRYTHETKTYSFTRHYFFYQGAAGGDPTTQNSTLAGTSFTYERWNPRAVINYQVLPNVMLYASYATGFTAGGINGRPFDTHLDIFPYQPEDVKAYEAGFKSELFDRRLRLNGDLYFSDYTNIQVGMSCFLQFSNPACLHPLTIFFTGNGGHAHIKGFELEAEAHPVPGWMINASAGYTDFKYVTIDPQAAGSITLNSPDGGVPKFTFNIGTQYDIHMGDHGTLTPRFDLTYNSTIHFNVFNTVTEFGKQPAYALVNARITWRDPMNRWSVSGAVTNLTDETYFTGKFDSRTGFGYATGTVAEPREFTITVRRNF
jgi:iron complex outermembrane receptor protein